MNGVIIMLKKFLCIAVIFLCLVSITACQDDEGYIQTETIEQESWKSNDCYEFVPAMFEQIAEICDYGENMDVLNENNVLFI